MYLYIFIVCVLHLVTNKVLAESETTSQTWFEEYLANITNSVLQNKSMETSSKEVSNLCEKWANFKDRQETIDRNECELPSGNFETIQPPVNIEIENPLILMFMTIITNLKWTSTCILYEQDVEYEALMLTESLSALGIVVTSNRTSNFENLHDIVDNNIDAIIEAESNITYLCKIECLQRIFNKPLGFSRDQVDKESMRHLSNWLIGVFTEQDISDIGHIQTEIDNLALLILPPNLLQNDDMYANINNTLKDEINSIKRNENVTAIESTQTQNLTQKVDVSNRTLCKWFSIQTLMWRPNAKREFDTVAYIQLSGKMLKNNQIFPNIKHAFNGRHFSVSTNTDPYGQWDPFVKKVNGSYDGFCMDLLEHLVTALNFTYNITMPLDNEWGNENPDGTWTGLVGQLARHEADLIAAPLSVSVQREQIIDFTHPFFFETTTILMKKLDPSHRKWMTFLDPFSDYVLLCIGITLPVSSFLLYLVEKLNPYYKELEEGTTTHTIRSFSDAFWYMFGALLTQGGEHMPESSSGRTLLSFWWIFCLITMATYCGNLIAFLTVTKAKLPFTNIHELVQQDQYKWGLTSGTHWVDQFKASALPELKQAWDGIVSFNRTDPSVLSTNPNTHINKVLAGKYAYIGDKTFMEVKMANQCELVMTNEELLPAQYAFGLPNNSPYTRLFSEEILRVQESGLLQIWKIRSWPKQNFCKGEIVTEAKRITLIDVQSAFYLIGIGIVAGSIALGGEYAKVYFKKWRDKKSPFEDTNSNIVHLQTNPRRCTSFFRRQSILKQSQSAPSDLSSSVTVVSELNNVSETIIS